MNNVSELRAEEPAAAISRSDLDGWFDQRFDEKMAERARNHQPTMTIIATKGTLDMAYPPFILASTAAALGWEVSVFFTFYGLELLKNDLDLRITPLGNPAMPMKLPFGPDWLQRKAITLPTALASLPGFESAASAMMKQTMRNKGVASIAELRELSLEAGVKMVACQMTVDLFGLSTSDFIPEVSEWVGAASFLPTASTADVNLFV
jgi:peroxiredoxin family protein